MEVRLSNMNAAKGTSDASKVCMLSVKAVSDAVRTSLGPKGMDKMVSLDDRARTDISDPDFDWRGRHHQRRSDYSQAHGCSPPCCSYGE